MPSDHTGRFCAGLTFACVVLSLAGCRTSWPFTVSRQHNVNPAPEQTKLSRLSNEAACDPRTVDSAKVSADLPPRASPSASEAIPVAFTQESELKPANTNLPEVLPSPANELSLDALIADVQARNPSLQAMISAWQAAAERYPQVVALDDPMLGAALAPGSVNSSIVETAYAYQVGQKIPWFGKRAARGQVASNEADAAFHEVDDSRLQISLLTQNAFFDYYLAHRQLEINQDNVKLMEGYRDTAQTKFRNNQVTQQDVLQAQVELADLKRRQIELERMLKVAIARINTLLRELPNTPLAPPPAKLPIPPHLADAELLREMAIGSRPDLAALIHRIQAEEASLRLAYKQFYPDVEVFGRYDTFWQPASTQGPLRGQVGVNLNVPIYRQKLNAGVREAQFRLNQRQAEYEQRLVDIQYEVQSAYDQVAESEKTVKLYADSLIPITQQNIAAARTNYEVGKISFLELAIAQRQLISLRERHQEAIATYHRRLAELQRVVGGQIPFEPSDQK